jgi:uncharacterized membrane protein
MSEDHPLVARYLARLTERLGDLQPAERTEVVQEIRSHIAEAVSAGRPLETVLSTLGPADDLARAYAVELLLNPAHTAGRGSRVDVFLKLAGLLVLGSIPTFVIVVVLGAVGVSFTCSGIAVFGAGLAASMGALPSWITMDVDPRIAVFLGPPMAGVGVACLVALVWYVRFVARLVRRVLPGARGAGRA